MVEKVKTFVVKHKWIVALLGGAIVLWLLLRGKGSDSTDASGVSTGGAVDPNVQIAAIQAGAQQQSVQAAAVAQVTQLNAQLAGQESQQHFQLAEDTLAAQQNSDQTAAAATIANNQIGAQVTLGQQAADVAVHQDNTQAAVAQATLQTQQDIADFAQQSLTNNTKIAADLQMGIVNSNNQTELSKYATGVQGQVDIAAIAGSVANAQITSNEDIQNHVLSLVQSGALRYGGVAGATQNAIVGAIAAPTTGVGPAIAGVGNSVANQPSVLSQITGLISAAGSAAKNVGTIFL